MLNLEPEQNVKNAFPEAGSVLSSGTHPNTVSTRKVLLILGLAGIALIFTLIILQFSFRFGRLATLPQFDDCAYLLDGATRLTKLHKGGIATIYQDYLGYRPHSPYSTYMAELSFAIFGIEYWAPYATNFLIVFLLLLFIDHILRGKSIAIKASCYLIALCIPITGKAVFEYRPDIPCGLFTAIGVLLILHRPWLQGSLKRRLGVGMLFGMAMLTKPSAFPFTVGIFVGSLGLASISEWFMNTSRPKLLVLLKSFVPSFLVWLLISLPHYYFQLREILVYIYKGMVEEKHIWVLNAGRMEHIRWFLDGPGGKLMIGNYVYILPAIGILGFVMGCLARKKEIVFRQLSLGCVIFVAYAIPTINPVKTQFFAVTFDWLLLLTAIVVIRDALSCASGQIWQTRFVLATCMTATVAGVFSFEWPEYYGERNGEVFSQREKFADKLYGEIKRRVATVYKPNTLIFTTSISMINEMNFGLFFLRDGQLPPEFCTASKLGIMEDQLYNINRADIVIAPEPGAAYIYDWLPVAKMQGDILKRMRENHDFKLSTVIPTESGKSYFIFQRVELMSGLTPVHGFSEREGPYPQWGIPVVAWGLYPSSRLNVIDRGGGTMILSMSCKTDLPGQQLTVKQNGKEVFKHSFEQTFHFYELTVPLEMTAGENIIEFNYATGASTVAKPMAVLFQKLQLDKN